MAQRNRRGSQISLELPPELLQRLKQHAAERDATVAAIVRGWIELGLGIGSDSGLDARLGASVDASAMEALANRVTALEAALAALKQQPPQPPLPQSGEPVRTPAKLQTSRATSVVEAPPEGAITTAELADRTGTNRAAWNNWAAPNKVGAVRRHPEAGAWKLVGKAATEIGGPPRWLWEAA